MAHVSSAAIAVIFINRRNSNDPGGYANAAAAMEAAAAVQPGYAGIESTRGADGAGITISYWEDEASAAAWRDHAEHAATRARGRALWYDSYEVIVTEVLRRYSWHR